MSEVQQSLGARLRNRPRLAVCVLVLISAIASGIFYVVSLAMSAHSFLGMNPILFMLVMGAPYLIAGIVAFAMTFFSRMNTYCAVHAAVAMAGVSVEMLILRLLLLDTDGGDMLGLVVLMDLAAQAVLVLLAFLGAYVMTRHDFKDHRAEWAAERKNAREARALQKMKDRRHW